MDTSSSSKMGCYPKFGQHYSKLISHGNRSRTDWLLKTTGRMDDIGSFEESGPGCSSLWNMSVRCVLMNLNSITAENLAGIPWHIGAQLCDHVLKQ